MEEHILLAQNLFKKIADILEMSDISFRVIQRRTVSTKRYIAGYINLRTKVIALDILTPKKMRPRSPNGLIRTLAHEIAHIQKMPFRQRYKGRWITRQHYPEFYQQIEKNINKIKKDPELAGYFK